MIGSEGQVSLGFQWEPERGLADSGEFEQDLGELFTEVGALAAETGAYGFSSGSTSRKSSDI
jgi:hypothetical protein